MGYAFKRVHPSVSFLFFIGAFLLLTLEQHPVFLGVDLLLLGTYLISIDRGHFFRQWGWGVAVMFLLFFVMSPLLNHRGTHILFFFRENPIMLESVLRGAMMALTLMGVLILMGSFNIMLTANKFLFLFSRFFSQWALLILLCMRFVPLLRHRLQDLQTVQKSRGLSVVRGKWRQRVTSATALVQILLTWSLEEAIQTADSMMARGYGLKQRTSYHSFQFRLKDGIVLVVCLALLALNFFGWWLGDSVLSLYPVLETPFLHGREWVFLGLNGLYFVLPFIIDLEEVWRWHYSRRKI